MIKNWKVTAWLSSPLAGSPPAFDALLYWELSSRLGLKHGVKTTRSTPLKDIPTVPIPLAQYTISGRDVYCCSDPIIPVNADEWEWQERISKRIDTSLIALLLAPEERKNLLVGSGHYKMMYRPIRIRLVERVCWFVRGDKQRIKNLLKSVVCIGSHRGIGYRMIGAWEFEEQDWDYSIFADSSEGIRVLMKTVPMGSGLLGISGYKQGFGGAFPPYWHPETYKEIAIPC